jgi:hypothetical protein
VTTLRAPTGPEAAPGATDGAKDAKNRGPLTPAEKDQDYRKRQAEAQKASAKAAEEQKNAEISRENCERAKEAVRSLEIGGRIVRTDARGERYYLDDEQIAQELAKSRQMAQQWCK